MTCKQKKDGDEDSKDEGAKNSPKKPSGKGHKKQRGGKGSEANNTTEKRKVEQDLEECEKEQGEAVRVDAEAADDADADVDGDKDI